MEHTPTLAPIWSTGQLPPEIEQKILEQDKQSCAIHLPCVACDGKMRPIKMCETPREFICENGHMMMIAHVPPGVTIDVAIPGVQHCLSAETIQAINEEAQAINPDGTYAYVEQLGKSIINRFPDLKWSQLIYLVWQCVPNLSSREFGLMEAGIPMDLIEPSGHL